MPRRASIREMMTARVIRVAIPSIIEPSIQCPIVIGLIIHRGRSIIVLIAIGKRGQPIALLHSTNFLRRRLRRLSFALLPISIGCRVLLPYCSCAAISTTRLCVCLCLQAVVLVAFVQPSIG